MRPERGTTGAVSTNFRWLGPNDKIEDRSLVFKSLQVVRFFDRERNVLVYISYSDRVLSGSLQNSISSVPIMVWPRP